MVELDDDATIPIIRIPVFCHPNVMLPAAQRREHLTRRSTNVKVAEADTLPMISTSTLMASTERHGLLTIEQDPSMLPKTGCMTTNGVMLFQPGRDFHMVVTNFSKKPRQPEKGIEHRRTAPSCRGNDVFGLHLRRRSRSLQGKLTGGRNARYR